VTPGSETFVVRPLRATLLDEPFRVVDEILEAAIVQVGDRQGHRSLLRGDHVDGKTRLRGSLADPIGVPDVDVER